MRLLYNVMARVYMYVAGAAGSLRYDVLYMHSLSQHIGPFCAVRDLYRVVTSITTSDVRHTRQQNEIEEPQR